MASQTPNLGLKLLGVSLQDKETLFEDWRQDIAGEDTGSNMNIIDMAYKVMADDIDNIKNGVITDEQIDALFE